MHFEAGGANEEARATEGIVFGVVTQNVANVLAEKTFDALAKFLNAVDVALVHFPFDVFSGLERGDFLVDLVVPGDVGDEILDDGKGFERRDGNGLVEREGVHTRFTGEAGAGVDFGGAGGAFWGFANSADGEDGGMMGLGWMGGGGDGPCRGGEENVV